MADVSQLLALQVIIPIFLALISSLIKNKICSFIILFVNSIACLIIGSILLECVLSHDALTLTYNMGGWPASYGIELRLTNFSGMILFLIDFLTLITSLYGVYAIPKEIKENRIHLFISIFLLCYAGLVGIIITNDVFNLYVFLEISSLATYTLVASSGSNKSYIAAFDYLIIGTISATFYLIGVGFLYTITGTLNMDILSEKIPYLINNRITQVGASFIIIGVAIKSALFPLHLWLTKVYAYSSSFVASFLCGTSTKVGMYIFIKYVYMIFGTKLLFNTLCIDRLFLALGLLGILLGAIHAVTQIDIKKTLAYSSVSQIGYIVLAIFLSSEAGIIIALMMIVTHSITKTSLFILAGYLEHSCSIVKFEIIKNKIPSIATVYFFISAFSLIGIPLTGGFITKLYLLNLTFDARHYIASLIVIISSVITAIYIWKLSRVFFNRSAKETYFPKVLHLPLGICAAFNIIIGIYAKPIMNLSKIIF